MLWNNSEKSDEQSDTTVLSSSEGGTNDLLITNDEDSSSKTIETTNNNDHLLDDKSNSDLSLPQQNQIDDFPPDEDKSITKIESNQQTEVQNCYCGKDRNMFEVEILCANCNRWYHQACLNNPKLGGKLVPFLMNYVFLCKNCSLSGESFRKFQAQIAQMCITALANLQQRSVTDGSSRTLFSKDKEIIPYLEQNWEAITTTPRRVTQSWHSTVHRVLVKDIHILFVFEEHPSDGQMYGLINSDVAQIRPNYEGMIKGGTLKMTGHGVKVRNTKRKVVTGDAVTNKKGRTAVDLTAAKLPAHGYPLDHPFNKDGYRYLLAEPDPHAPYRQEFDESSDWAGKPIPGWLYRILVPNNVLLALHDRAPQLKISEDRLSVTGDKGYSTVRATHGVTWGIWYWEATIDEMPEGSATRMGWGQDYGNLQAPLGYDKFGYSWRSRKGTRFHESIGKHYSIGGYGEGDTLGFLIILPQNLTTKLTPNTYKDRPLVKFKNHLYYEDKDNVPDRLKGLKPVANSKIIFFKNGECQGVAFEDIHQGCYYPTVSLHRNATVTVNFGPNFKYYPDEKSYNAKGMHCKVEEAFCEQTVADLIYLTEHDGKLRLDSFVL